MDRPRDRATVVRPDSASEESVPAANGFANGQLVADTYRIRRRLGAGGMATVYLARHEEWDLDVALKVPNAEILAAADHRHRLMREAETWTKLGLHPHIAYCYYAYPLDELVLVVVEYLDGGNLRDWIAERKCADLRTGLDLAIQFCHGLEHAHSNGMIHKDIKPENILLSADGMRKLTDFGIVRLLGDGAESGIASARGTVLAGTPLTVQAVGTYDYMAPEQFVNPREVDARADIFSFGVCLYEMWCGQRPYPMALGSRQEAADPRWLRGDGLLPERLCALVRRCVAWERDGRPASVQEIRNELCEIYQDSFGKASPWAKVPEVAVQADGLNNQVVSYWVLGRREKAEKRFPEAQEKHSLHPEARLGDFRPSHYIA